MVQFLPKEVVIRIMQNLSDLDLVRAAQTNKFWRSCIHNYPPLWTSLSLFFPHEVETSALRLNLVNAKLKFHEDRLPLTSRAIIHLSICSYASMRCILEADLPGELELLLSGRHRFFTPGLQSISLLGYCREQCLLARWSQEARLGSLSCLTLLAGPLKYPLSKILQLCPRLRRISYLNNDALDPFCGSITQSADNLYENEQDGGGLPQNRGLKRWVIHPSKYHAPFIMGEADHHLLTDLEHLELGAVEDPSKLPRTESETSISDSESEAATLDYDCQAKPPLGPNFFSTFSMASLRILRLVDAQFSTAFQWPEDLLNDGHVNRLGLKVEGSVLDEALETPLDMPNLAICQLIQAAGSDNCAPERFCAHPSHLLCRLRAPRLLHLTLSGYGQMLVNSDPEAPLLRPLQYKSWSVFSQNHSQLKELYVFDTDLPEPEGLGKNFPDLNVLCLSGFRLPDDFLDPKGLERFPRLRYLMLMRCVKLDYWRFELSLKDMQRELQYWQEHIRPEENWRKVAFGTAPRLAQIAQRVQLGTHEMLLQGMTTL